MQICKDSTSTTILLGKTYYFNNKNIRNYSQIQGGSLKLRGSIIDWLYIINKTLNDSSTTFFHSIKIFDDFLSKNPNTIPLDEIQLYAAVCYFISKKFNEVIMLSIPFVTKNILKNKFTQLKIIQTELYILKTVKFSIGIDTVQSYTNYFLYVLSKCFSYEHTNQILDDVNTGINIFSMQILEFIFEYSPLSMSIISLLCSLKIIKENNLVNEDEIKACMTIMRNSLGESVYVDLYQSNFNISNTLYDVIKVKKDWLLNKQYFKMYFDLYYKSNNNDSNNINNNNY